MSDILYCICDAYGWSNQQTNGGLLVLATMSLVGNGVDLLQ